MLIGFTLVSLVAASALRGEQANNYDGAQLYIKGFMQTFQGSNYTLPAACMSPAFQATLDHDVVALLKTIVIVNEEKFNERVEAFKDDFNVMVSQCDMMSVVNAFKSLLAQKNGEAILASNIFWNMFELENDLIKSFNDLFFKRYQLAGSELGSMVKILTTNPNKKLMAYTDISDFGSGLITGLGADKESVCYGSYQELDSIVRALVEDYAESGRISPQLMIDLMNLKSSAPTFFASCDFSGLISQLSSVTESTVLQNYRANAEEINPLMLNLKDCESNLSLCGYSIGSALNILTGASL